MSHPEYHRPPLEAPVLEGWVRARANVNIALIKYWGKAPGPSSGGVDPRAEHVNIPAVPSLSLTLADLYSETWARFAPDRDEDVLSLDDRPLEGAERARAVALLDALRARFDIAAPFEIVSFNAVPTGAGLASSASGMAALAAAAGRCAGLLPQRHDQLLSELARVGSGSASRSIFGGWVRWRGAFAEAVAPRDHLPLAVVVAVISTAKKAIGSRAAMQRTARTSPYYGAWVQQAHEGFEAAEAALRDRDLDALLAAMERSTWRMHAAAMAAEPPIVYLQPPSLAVLAEVAHMRSEGITCGATLDAGPNVKVFCRLQDAAVVARRLNSVPGVGDTITTTPGTGIQVSIESQQPQRASQPPGGAGVP